VNPTQKIVTESVQNLNVWQRGDQRAPHKPLLILLALGRIVRGQERLAAFTEIDEPLRRLLVQFGPPRKSVHSEYPFWRLQTNGLWEVVSEPLGRRKGNTDPLKSELIAKSAMGGFPEKIWEELKNNRRFLAKTALYLLKSSFPESIHSDILNEVGLPSNVYSLLPRESGFMSEVLRAYEHRCAICSFEVKVGSSDLATEAAHIKWHQAGGPERVENGLALCSIHHKGLDRGALGFTSDLTVLISTEIHGGGALEWFDRYKGRKLRLPTKLQWRPNPEYVTWHQHEVFKGPAKD